MLTTSDVRVSPSVVVTDPAGEHHVRAAQDGDESAFVTLYRHVQPGLLRYLSVLVGDDAEDVAAETWSQVCRDLHTFRGSLDGFRGWVATIGRHRALDHLRSVRRRPSVPCAPEDLPLPPPDRDSGELALEAIATRDALQLIATLPPDQAEAVLLRTVLGLDAATAGRVLGKRAGAVRTAAHRGLRALAARLAEQPTDPTSTDPTSTGTQRPGPPAEVAPGPGRGAGVTPRSRRALDTVT